MNLRLIVAGATLAGAVSLSALLFGTGAAVAEPAAPPAPAEQAAGSDPATGRQDERIAILLSGGRQRAVDKAARR